MKRASPPLLVQRKKEEVVQEGDLLSAYGSFCTVCWTTSKQKEPFPRHIRAAVSCCSCAALWWW